MRRVRLRSWPAWYSVAASLVAVARQSIHQPSQQSLRELTLLDHHHFSKFLAGLPAPGGPCLLAAMHAPPTEVVPTCVYPFGNRTSPRCQKKDPQYKCVAAA